MANEEKKDDPLNILAEGAVDGVGTFLSKICLPAAEEFGLLLRDHVRFWRTKNFVSIARKTQRLLENKKERIEPKINPRLLNAIYENGSWIEQDELQSMWAGLFAASCQDEKSDGNILYIDILSKISVSEAYLLNYFCKNCEFKISGKENIVAPQPILIFASRLKDIAQKNNFEDVVQYLSHLELLGLVERQTYALDENPDSYDSLGSDNYLESDHSLESIQKDKYMLEHISFDMFEISVTNLGFRLFLKCNGIAKRPSEYVKSIAPLIKVDDD